MHETHKETAILYHGGCPDGLGGAYAAWKKFGDAAEYIPVKHGHPAPMGLAGRKLYFVDFCYPKDTMDAIAAEAASVTVLDHHLGIKDVVESMPDYVFDEHHSGAVIAWNYFHPGTPVPTLLTYIEDGDLYRFALPQSRAILAYEYNSPLLNSAFEHWDAAVRELDDPMERERIIQKGAIFQEYHEHVIENGVRHAEVVEFEGYECFLVGSSGEFVSDIGNRLVQAKPPIAIIVSADASELRISLRSDKTVDVAALARKHGGNGHPAAAGFKIALGGKVPWKPVEKIDEHTGH
ncbi:MAG: hypothetical protein KGH56_00715 [Patescibacteria group bacterium]|nr:hypothetical protein [Patescibacteria group bacterium]